MNIKKIISSLLAIFIIVPSFSFAETNSKITYEDALKIAINNNLSLERTKRTIKTIDDNLEEGSSLPNYMYLIDPSITLAESQGMLELQSNLDVQRKIYKTQEEAITLGVKNLFYDIENYEKSKKVLQDEITIKRMEWNIISIKKNLGLVSEIDFQNAQTELDKLNNSLKEADINIESAYSNLEHLIGTNNGKKIEYIKIDYIPLDKSTYPLEAMKGIATSEAPTIYAQNESIKMLERRLNLGLFDGSLTSLPNKEQKKSVEMMDVDMRDAKENLKNTVIETYNNIQKLEQEIENLDFTIENLETQVDNLKLMVKVGNATLFEQNSVELQLEKAKSARENLVRTHDILKNRYEKPYLLAL